MLDSIKIFLLLLLIYFTSCSTSERLPSFREAVNESGGDIPKILFIYFNAERDTITGNVTVKILETRVAEGKLKRGFAENHNIEPGSWLFSFLDTDKKRIDSFTMLAPFIVRGEFADIENKIESVISKLNKAEFFIRTEFKRNFKYLRIEIIEESNVIRYVTEIDLLE